MATIYVASTSGGSPTTPIVQQRWNARTNKAVPVLADSICALDSANSGNEIYSTYAQAISSLSIITYSSAIAASRLIVSSSPTQVADSGIIADHSQNLSGVGTINGITLTNLLVNSNNLSDVSNKGVSFNNISPLLTKGDLIAFDGTNNIRVPAATNGYILQTDSTQTSGLKWAAPGSVDGFVDNAVFVGTAGQPINGSTPTALNITSIISSSTGNTWTTNGDNAGMKCGTAGYYNFFANIPVATNTASGGVCYFRFAKNGTVFGPMLPINMLVANEVIPVPLFAQQQFAANDVLTINGYTGTTSTYIVEGPGTSGALHATSVNIMRLA